MTKIKVCGITHPSEIAWLNELQVDYAGFVFYEKSRRALSVATAEKLSKKLNSDIKKVAVTVSPDERLADEICEAGFDIIQIHGELTEKLKEYIRIPIWRACNLTTVDELSRLERELSPEVSGILADAGSFGSGRTFGWEQAAEGWQEAFAAFRRSLRERGITFLLAGGLNDRNVADGVRLFEPDVVDVSSGVERPDADADGSIPRKSRELLQAFCMSCR